MKLTRRTFLGLSTVAALASSGCVRGEGVSRGAKPNILIITADNLGYGDLRSYNPRSEIIAPNLDRFATQGARFTSFYTASPTCTVSRACLLTGRIPQRHGLTEQLGGVDGNYGVGLNQNETLISQQLKNAPTPYATGCFGKWNIGFAPGSRPTERGFDEFIGHASGNIDYYRHNYRDKHDMYVSKAETQGTDPSSLVPRPAGGSPSVSFIDELHREGEYSTDLFADAAIDFIQRRSKTSQPWFCYLPFNAPHFPSPGNRKPGEPNIWQAPDWAFEEYGFSPDESDPEKRYRAVVTALDRAIGRVVDALDASGAADNTFVFFMSDNGAFRLGRQGLDVGSNEPLRHGGVTCWEGGLRVPAMARWPKKIPAGSVVSGPFWSPDLFAVCSRLAGANLPDGIVLDGKDSLDMMTQGAKSPHESFYFNYQKHAALRKGDWKIVREKPDAPWQLYNLAEDVSESRDRAGDSPERVGELVGTLREWERSF